MNVYAVSENVPCWRTLKFKKNGGTLKTTFGIILILFTSTIARLYKNEGEYLGCWIQVTSWLLLLTWLTVVSYGRKGCKTGWNNR